MWLTLLQIRFSSCVSERWHKLAIEVLRSNLIRFFSVRLFEGKNLQQPTSYYSTAGIEPHLCESVCSTHCWNNDITSTDSWRTFCRHFSYVTVSSLNTDSDKIRNFLILRVLFGSPFIFEQMSKFSFKHLKKTKWQVLNHLSSNCLPKRSHS